jgi:hypothetical protein
MKVRSLFLFLALVLCVACLSPLGASRAEIVPLSSSVYDDMVFLFRSQNLAVPSQAKPWSIAEVSMMLSLLNPREMNALESSIFTDIISKTERNIACSYVLTPGLSITPEIYAHSNEADFTVDTDWVNGFDSRNPFAKAWLEIGISDFLYTYGELSYGWGRVTYKDTVVEINTVDHWSGVGAIVPKSTSHTLIQTHSAIYSPPVLFNFPDITMLEIDIPRRAVLALGGSHWFATLSRDKIDWGGSHIGNFVLDSHVDYQDYFRFKAFSDKLSLDIVTMFFETDYNSANSSIFDGEMQLFLTHRLEYRPVPRLSFAISENVMYRTPSLELRYFNPAFIFHNLNNSRMFNAIAHAEVDIAVANGLGLYGQFVLDQATAPTESASQAPAWGASIGADFRKVVGYGILSTNIEFAYTTPMLYRRNHVDFLMFHKYSTNKTYKRVLVFDYIGFPYGGDAQVLQLEVGYDRPSVFSARIRLQARRHGEMDFYESHNSGGSNEGIPNIKDKTPYGNEVTDTCIASLYGRYWLPMFWRRLESSIHARLDIVGIHIWTKDGLSSATEKADVQFTLGMTLTLR